MELVSKAIEFAVRAHDGQRRKGSPSPYILHPMEAAVIVGSMTDKQEVIAAAVLHDVVEDAEIAPEEIEREFGPRVRELVMSETEPRSSEESMEQTWLARKQEAIEFLRQTTDLEAKMLYLGDKLSNLRSVARDLQKHGPALWERFHQKDPKMQRWYYSSIGQGLSELKDTRAWQEYNELVEDVFGPEKG